MSLQWVGQDDFAAGTLVGLGQDQQPGVGLERAINGIFDDDGDVWRRGPVNRLGIEPADGPLTFQWSGYLGTGYVELVATTTHMYAVTLAGEFVDLGTPGLTEPVQPAIVADMIFLPNGFVWGGSLKAPYSTGTVALTEGSATVTGTGTSWLGNVESGMLIRGAGTGATGWLRIKSVESDTALTTDVVHSATSPAPFPYEIVSVTHDGLPATNRARHLGTAGGRLLIATDNRIAFSKQRHPLAFDPTDYHELPDGAVVQGLSSIRDRVLVFSIYGLWSITNMSFDLTDDFGNPQQELQRLTPEISLLHEAGLADWSGMVVAPCVDRCFLIDGLSPPVPVSDSVSSIYMRHVREGHKPGGAKVFRSHYFLPVLDETRTPVDLLVCRLNRPVRARQLYYPWAQWDGYPVGISAFDVDLRTRPVLKAVHHDGWRLDASDTFPPFSNEEPVTDADGEHPTFDVETRDYPTGNGQPNHVRKLRLFYFCVGTGELRGAYSIGNIVQRWRDLNAFGRTWAEVETDYANWASVLRGFTIDTGSIEWTEDDRFWTPVEGTTLEPPGTDPKLWNLQATERERYIRARFRSTDGIPQIKIRIVQFAVRPTSHTR